MTPRGRLLLATALLTVAGLLASAGPAAAAESPTSLSLQFPEAMELGAEVTMTATLRTQAGEPLGSARVFLSQPAEFGGVAGNMELGSRVTDAQGTAAFRYAPRQSGPITLFAQYPGDALHGPSQAEARVMVSGERQLYVAEAGLRVPVLSVVLLAGALGLVFSLYTAVGLLVWGIARQGEEAATPGGSRD